MLGTLLCMWQFPTTDNDAAQNVNSAVIEKPAPNHTASGFRRLKLPLEDRRVIRKTILSLLVVIVTVNSILNKCNIIKKYIWSPQRRILKRNHPFHLSRFPEKSHVLRYGLPRCFNYRLPEWRFSASFLFETAKSFLKMKL